MVYSENTMVNAVITMSPLIFCEVISIITLIKFYRFYKVHPEDITKKLMCRLTSANRVVPLHLLHLQPRLAGQGFLPAGRGQR